MRLGLGQRVMKRASASHRQPFMRDSGMRGSYISLQKTVNVM